MTFKLVGVTAFFLNPLVDERKKIWYDIEKIELDFYERRREDAKEHEEI